jgi:cytochrome c-type biogenesis protein CcmH
MIMFWIAATGLLCLAVGLVLLPLLRQRPPSESSNQGHSNLKILQDHFRQLNEELASGQLTHEQHQQAVGELERRVLEEEKSIDAAPQGAARKAPRTALVLGLLIPLLTLGMYDRLGHPDALNPQPQAAQPSGEIDITQVNAMVEKLAQRMAQEPNNVEGWTRLSRAYAMLQQFEQAQKAYVHTIAISPPDAQLLADLADVQAILQGQSTLGEPEKLAHRALKIDPRNVKAMALAGSAAFERQDYAQAAALWAEALPLAPANGELAKAIESNLAIARAQAGTSPQTVAPTQAQITGVVRLSPALAGRVSPGDTLFIFARAAEGPRMPLAIVRSTAQNLPLSFTLDDSSAMSPQTRLSQFKTVIVGARISKSGEALPQSGDLIGQSMPVSHLSQGLEIVIDASQP